MGKNWLDLFDKWFLLKILGESINIMLFVYLLDNTFKINSNSNLLKCYIPWMLDDMFKLTIDVRYWKKEHDDAEPQKPLSIKGY